MGRKVSLGDLLAGRGLQIQKGSTRGLTRAQRRAMAPKEPRGPALRYLRFQTRMVEEIRELVMAKVEPILPELVGLGPLLPELEPSPKAPVGVQEATDPDAPKPIVETKGGGLRAGEDPPDARIGVPRTDALPCGCGPGPAWYAALLKASTCARRDAPGGRWAEILAGLEVAITERTGARQNRVELEGIAKSIWEHNRAEMSRVLQIDLRRQELGLQDFIQRFTEQNVRLITSVGFDQLDRMEKVVANATAGQDRVETLRDQIESTFNVTRARASLIARDQTLKSNAELIQLRQQQVGVTEYIWTTSKDERVRGRPGGKWEKSQSDHWVLDGTRQSWLVPPVTNPETGATNHPGQDYQCRCTATPIVDHLLSGERSVSVSVDPPQRPAPLVVLRGEPLPENQVGRGGGGLGVLASILEDIIPQPTRGMATIRGAYEGASPEDIDAIATGQALPMNARVSHLPPIKLSVEPDGTVNLTDGNHRLAAAREAGAKQIRAIVRRYRKNGTYTEREVILPIGSAGIDLSRVPGG